MFSEYHLKKQPAVQQIFSTSTNLTFIHENSCFLYAISTFQYRIKYIPFPTTTTKMNERKTVGKHNKIRTPEAHYNSIDLKTESPQFLEAQDPDNNNRRHKGFSKLPGRRKALPPLRSSPTIIKSASGPRGARVYIAAHTGGFSALIEEFAF